MSAARPLASPGAARGVIALSALIAALLRVSGLDWGLPTPARHYPLHPDEPIIALAVLRVDPLNLQSNPGMFNYGTLSLYLDRLVLDAVLATNLVRLAPDQPGAAARLVGETIRVGRWVTVLLGVLTVAGIGLLGWRLFDPRAGALAAFLLAAAPLHLAHGHYNTVDVPAAWRCTLCLLICAGALKSPGRGALALAGACAGLAASTKYNAGLVLLAPLYTLAATWRRKEWNTSDRAAALLYVPIAAAGAFLLTTPGIFLDPRAFWRDLSYEFWHSGAGHGLVFFNTPPAWLYHAIHSLPDGLGWPLTLAVAGGVIAALLRRRPADGLLLAFILPYYLLIGTAETKFSRYLLPIIPALLLLAARLLATDSPDEALSPEQVTTAEGGTQGTVPSLKGTPAEAPEAATASPRPALPGNTGTWGVFRGVAMALTLLWTTVYGIAMAEVFTRPDPRDQAADWVLTQQPSAGRVGLLGEPWFYTPPLTPSLGCTHALARACGAAPPAWVSAPQTGQVALSPADLDTAIPTFFLASEFEYGDPLRLQREIGHHDATTRLLQHLERRYQSVRAFRNRPHLGPFRWFQHSPPVHDLLYPMPDVKVYRATGR
jgi:hypothetical protein